LELVYILDFQCQNKGEKRMKTKEIECEVKKNCKNYKYRCDVCFKNSNINVGSMFYIPKKIKNNLRNK